MIETMRRLHPRGAANRGVCVDAGGAMLGPDWPLVERTAAGYRVAARVTTGDIQKVLLIDRQEPDWLYEQGRRIADALNRGEIALAQIYGLRIPIGEIDQRQLKRLSTLAELRKAGFNPDEPRIPAGQPAGGEWTTGGDAGTAPLDPRPQTGGTDAAEPTIEAQLLAGTADTSTVTLDAHSALDGADSGAGGLEAQLIEAGYNLTPDLWTVLRDLYKIYTTPGSTLASLEQYLAEHGLNLDELPSVIKSLFDSPKSLADLQTDKPSAGFLTEAQLKAYLGDPPPGYEWHHIIEQNGQFRPDLTSPEGIQEWIQNTDNIVAVPVIKHYCVNGIMSSVPQKGSGVRFRDIVKFHNPFFQREIGLGLLRFCGAIQ